MRADSRLGIRGSFVLSHLLLVLAAIQELFSKEKEARRKWKQRAGDQEAHSLGLCWVSLYQNNSG